MTLPIDVMVPVLLLPPIAMRVGTPWSRLDGDTSAALAIVNFVGTAPGLLLVPFDDFP